jgi:hypothetical protein
MLAARRQRHRIDVGGPQATTPTYKQQILVSPYPGPGVQHTAKVAPWQAGKRTHTHTSEGLAKAGRPTDTHTLYKREGESHTKRDIFIYIVIAQSATQQSPWLSYHTLQISKPKCLIDWNHTSTANSANLNVAKIIILKLHCNSLDHLQDNRISCSTSACASSPFKPEWRNRRSWQAALSSGTVNWNH